MEVLQVHLEVHGGLILLAHDATLRRVLRSRVLFRRSLSLQLELRNL